MFQVHFFELLFLMFITTNNDYSKSIKIEIVFASYSEAIGESNGRSDFNTFCPSRNENSQQKIQNLKPVIYTDLEKKL